MRHVAYKPLGLAVTTASRLIVPSVAGDEGQFEPWTAGETVAVGDKRVASNGVAYWCTAITTGVCATEPSATDGDDSSDAAVSWRVIRPRRSQIIITNDSDVVIYLALGNAAVANKGIRLNPAGGTFNAASDWIQVPQCDIFAIAASGSDKNLVIQEG